MRFQLLTLLCLVFTAAAAHAQHEGQSLWLNVDYTYTDLNYKETTMTEKGRLAGARGELGLGLLDNFGVSAGGQYQDGNLNYDGATFTAMSVKTTTSDYLRETYVNLNFMFGPLTISGGTGQREWYNNVPTSYRRRVTYNYYPITMLVSHGGFYFKAENIIWKSGKTKAYLPDVNPLEKDTEFTHGSGSMYGAEIGFQIPTAIHFTSHIYLAYRRWEVSESDSINERQISKNSTVTLQGGLGLGF